MNLAGPTFTHVMDGDDLMFFAKASSQEVQILDGCLEQYCAWSGQRVNRDNSGLIFSKHVNRDRRRVIKQILHMKKAPPNAIYLGAPLFPSASKVKDFQYLLNKVKSRLTGWRSKMLSWVGRCTMINSVVSAIPVHSFSTFDVPASICNKLDASARRFWWNPKKTSGRFVSWKSWDKLCLPKLFGGLGFRQAKLLNDALLAKFTWFVISNKESPCFNALRSKYKVRGGWMHREPFKNALSTWRAIERLRPVIKQEACFIVGDGSNIDCWKDPWVLWLPSFLPCPKDASVQHGSLIVSNLIIQSSKSWNVPLLTELFDPVSVKAICRIPIPLAYKQDKLVWVANSKGEFSVKSDAKVIQAPVLAVPCHPVWKLLWKSKLHERLKTFVWRIGSDTLPTNLKLHLKMGIGDPCCPLCLGAEESTVHLFFKCPVTRAIWFRLCWGLRPNDIPVLNELDIVKCVVSPHVCLPSIEIASHTSI